jgi:RNA polymerase sigma factor (sigma-70 family)
MNNDINAIAEKYGSIVTAISFRMIEDRDLAKDAAQEAWIEIIKSLPSFKGESKISTWIYTIASRTILRHSKNEQKYSVRFISEFLDRDEIVYSDSILEEKEWTKEMCDKCITGSIHCLTNEERLIYLLHEAAGLDSREIAEILPVSDTAVRKKMSRSRRKLHSFLNNQCILYNPEGNCKCRIIKSVNKINLQKEFQKIKTDIHEISFLRQCDEILSTNKTFFHKLCHSYNFPSTN